MSDKIDILEHALKIVREILVIIVLLGIVVTGFRVAVAYEKISNYIENFQEVVSGSSFRK